MDIVLDASALLSYLEKEPGYEKVKNLLTKASETNKNLLMASVNWGEICYILMRNYGMEEADEILTKLRSFPIDIVDVNAAIAEQGALFKAKRKLPYVDSLAAALTKILKGELVTRDREFSVIADEIRIVWV